VTAERREAILSAFARCVARDGVEGASLQEVADEAGLARGLLRHHVGNREELILALGERFCRQSLAEMESLVAALPQRNRLAKLIDLLFAAGCASTAEDLRVADALIAAAGSRPALRSMLRVWYDDFEAVIFTELRRAHPKAKRAAVAEVATAIVAMAFCADSLTPLGETGPIFARSRRAAHRLAATLAA
jgi:AcrR family transcriptional regulator